MRVWTTDAMDAARRSGVPPRRDLGGLDVHVARNLSNRAAWAHQLYLPLGEPPLDDVDLVHLHGHRHLLNHRAYAAARARGLPVVLTAHGTVLPIERKVALKRVWDRLVDGRVPFEADRVIATSRAEVRQLVGFGLPAERIVRIPNGLALDEFEALPARGTFRGRYRLGERPLVAYLGQITPRKGVDHLVAAFDVARRAGELRADATLVVAGSPRGMALPVAEGVVYTGTLEGPDRLALLVDADVLVYPSVDEVFGLVPLEGLMCGAPVVVSGDCGCGELIAEAGAGLLVPYGDRPRVAGAIAALLADRATAAAMVERGRRYIAHHLALDRVADAHLSLYEAVRA